MKRSVKTVVWLVVLVAGVALAAGQWVGGPSSDSSSVNPKVEDFRVLVETNGKIEAAVSLEIGPPSVRGFWEYDLTWMIPEGSDVEAGDVVARFDTTEFDDRLREHVANLETAKQEREKEQRSLDVSLRQLRLDLVKAKGELKKVDLDLSVPENLVSFIELEQTRLRKQLAERRVAFLTEKIEFEKQLVESKLALLDVKRAYEEDKIAYIEQVTEKFNVRAPVSGLVIYVPKRNGDRWEVGEGVWMLAKILEVADISTLQVKINVLEVDAARVEPGQAAEIDVDALPGLMLHSRVSEIGRIVHERSIQDPSKVFDAILPLDDVDTEDLRPGMGVAVEIETKFLPQQLTIPLEAVRLASEGPYVQLRRAGGLERRQIELGARNRKRVVVLAGLEEGDEIVIPTNEARS